MARPPWATDFLIVAVFAAILAVLSIVNIRTLRETYEQNEQLRTVNSFVDCLDPTTKCGMKLAAYQAAEREFLTNTMRNQAICTLLTSRVLRGENDMGRLEAVYNECVAVRTGPPPEPPKSPIDEEDED